MSHNAELPTEGQHQLWGQLLCSLSYHNLRQCVKYKEYEKLEVHDFKAEF